jgi:serine/threonine protein kinase
MVMGTPYYMSPEQARGDRNLDARVDLYACGVIMYEALTGRRPFHAQNYNALLLQILQTRPTPPSVLRPALPPGFEEVIKRAMAREREDRYQSAAEFQRALGELRESLAPRSKRPPRAQAVVGTSEGSTSIDIPITVADAPPPAAAPQGKDRGPRVPRPAYDVDDEAPTNLLRIRVSKPKKAAAPERPEPDDGQTTKRTGSELDAMLASLPAEDATIDENYSIELTPSSSSPKKRPRKPAPDDTVKTRPLLDEVAAEPGSKPRR